MTTRPSDRLEALRAHLATRPVGALDVLQRLDFTDDGPDNE